MNKVKSSATFTKYLESKQVGRGFKKFGYKDTLRTTIGIADE